MDVCPVNLRNALGRLTNHCPYYQMSGTRESATSRIQMFVVEDSLGLWATKIGIILGEGIVLS